MSSNYKMVENRKYNEDEIKFVISRVHAGWDPAIIAKAFKRHFGEYWANREFTKKQVAYIRSTYKPPPGVVKPYTGPIPDFTPSPSPEGSPQPPPTAGRKRKQPVRPGQIRSSSNSTPMYQTPTNQTPVYEQPGSPTPGPSRKRQRTQAPPPGLQGGSGEGQDPDLHSASNLLHSMNNARGETTQQELPNINNNEFDVSEEDPALGNASLEPNSPGMMLPGADDADDDDAPALPNYLDLHPNVPLQSIERHRSIAPGTNATNSGFPNPRQQQQHHHHPQPDLPYPPPHSHRGAVARDDPYGVWYFNPHDTCQVWLGHRHDFDGGVWFTSEASMAASLMAMRHTEGVGFMLGVATAAAQVLNMEGGRYFDGRGVDPHDLMQQVARVVRDHVPPEVLDEEGFAVPDPADVVRMVEMNQRLPAGNFYDPFHRRVVEYDMSGRGAEIQGGGQQGGGAPGPSRQRDGQGDGAAGSSRPSRQGTAVPPQVHRSTRQRTAAVRDGRPSRQGTGAPGASNSS